MNWSTLVYVVLPLYALGVLFVFSYSIAQLTLLISYLKNKRPDKRKSEHSFANEELPCVTVQLPVYNEMYVAERLLKAVAALDYPREKLEIQVLDDSVDETVEILRKQIDELHKEAIDIVHVRRDNRDGFKAGALAYGLNQAKGEFIAIFDADFLPEKEFLRKTVSAFRDKKVGLVQTRWGHVNEDYSLLTKLQAFGLDAHFTVEQKGRNAAGYFINFNGTAGIWRKACIIDSGGWASDTLTEDLDLSYRAQLKGWKFVFMEEVSTPAELPVTMSALKNQQYRWNKGAAECAKKNLPTVMKQRISITKKFHAAFHLMNSTIYIAIMLTAFLSIPLLFIKHQYPSLHWIFWIAAFFILGFVILGTLYFTATLQFERKPYQNVLRFIRLFPLFLSISMGLALHNAIAVIEGYLGRKTSFIRTPKFNIVTSTEKWNQNKYLDKNLSWITLLEGGLAIYFAYGIYTGIHLKDYALIPFHLMLTFGFASVFLYSVSHSLRTIRVRKSGDQTEKVIWGV